MQNAGASPGKPGRVRSRPDAKSSRFDTNEPDLLVGDERIEDPHGVAAAAHARDDYIRRATERLGALLSGLVSDHRLKLADHQRVRVRSEDRAEQVVTVCHRGHPVAHCFVDRVLQRAAPGVNSLDRSSEQLHAEHVERLARHILGAHIHVALEPE